MAADPRHQRRVVDDLTLGSIQAEPLGQAQRKEALPQHVLHRMAHPQVGAQRQRSEKLREPHPRRLRVVPQGNPPTLGRCTSAAIPGPTGVAFVGEPVIVGIQIPQPASFLILNRNHT